MKPAMRSCRRILIGVSLTAIVLGLLLSWRLGASEKAHAHFPHSGIDFSLTGPGGCSSDGTSTCNLAPGQTFQINWVLASIPGGFTYNGYDSTINYSGVAAVQSSLAQTGGGAWPDCSLPTAKFTVGTVQMLCAVAIGGPTPSSYTGTMWFMNFECPPMTGTGVISLLHGQDNTDLVDAGLVAHGEAASGSETLTINCSAPTPTPAPPGPLAGNGSPGFNGDGPASTAELNGPSGLTRSATGDLYIADSINCLIRRVSGGAMTTVAGQAPTSPSPPNPTHCGYNGESADARLAELNHPHDVFLDPNGTDLYIADTDNCRIRKVANVTSVPPGPISTVAGGSCTGSAGSPGAASANPLPPISLAVDTSSSTIYKLTNTCQLLKVINNVETVVAGTMCGDGGDRGPGTLAKLNNPNDIAILKQCPAPPASCSTSPSSLIIIADTGNNRIRSYDPASGVIDTIAGGGTGCPDQATPPTPTPNGCSATQAKLNAPNAVEALNNQVYIADTGNRRIWRVDMLYRTIYTVLSDLRDATTSNPLSPTGVAVQAGTTAVAYYCDYAASVCDTATPAGQTPQNTHPGNFVPASGCGLTPGVGTIDFALPAVLLGLIATRKRLRDFWRSFCALPRPRAGRVRIPQRSVG